jgi:hypothetical protein
VLVGLAPSRISAECTVSTAPSAGRGRTGHRRADLFCHGRCHAVSGGHDLRLLRLSVDRVHRAHDGMGCRWSRLCRQQAVAFGDLNDAGNRRGRPARAAAWRVARLSGFAPFSRVRSLFINELDEKVFTTEADLVSACVAIPIALCTSGFRRPFSLGPPRGRAYASLAEGTPVREQGRSSLQPFSACPPKISKRYHELIMTEPDQHRILGGRIRKDGLTGRICDFSNGDRQRWLRTRAVAPSARSL